MTPRAPSAPATTSLTRTTPTVGAPEGDGASAPSPHRRRRWLAVAGVVAVGVVAGTVVVRSTGGGAPAGSAATAIQAVERRDLARIERFDGELGFGETQTLMAVRGGVVTAVPDAGTVVEPGEVIVAVDIEPTVLLVGDLPAWRPLDVDSDPGADIEQLEAGLAALAYGGDLTVDDTFTAATAAAVEAWETDLGRPDPDGRVELGDVVFRPEAARVASVETDLGTTAQAGSPVLAYTLSTKVVTVQLDPDRTGLVAVGDEVTVELPDGTVTAGTVDDIATEATVADPTDPSAESTVPVTIALADPAAADAFDTGDVTVEVAGEHRDGVLAVPVTALLALTEGGYALQVPDASQPSGYRLVAVTTGLHADGWVEVSGDGIEPGTEVVVAE